MSGKTFFPIYFSLNIHLKLHRCKTKFKLDQELTGGFCIENYLTWLLWYLRSVFNFLEVIFCIFAAKSAPSSKCQSTKDFCKEKHFWWRIVHKILKSSLVFLSTKLHRIINNVVTMNSNDKSNFEWGCATLKLCRVKIQC